MASSQNDSQPIAPDDAVAIESDSAYGDDEIRSYTTSLASSVEKYVWEHGRRYHGYREGAYNFPNDEKEQDRMDLVHHVNLMMMDNQLNLAPLPRDKALRVLDVGTGTGIWAMDFGDQHPNAEVIGNDLSPIQPKWVPTNVSFEVDDCESPWPPRRPFDFVHVRYMMASIKDWPKLVQQCYEQTAPDGWVEFQDYNTMAYSEDGTAEPDNKFLEFCRVFAQATGKIGREGNPGRHLKGWVEGAGFKNAQHRMYKLPIGPWAKDPKQKRIGALYLAQLLEVLEAASIGLFTRAEGWSPEEVQVFLSGVRRDITKKTVHLQHEFHVVYGKKPE